MTHLSVLFKKQNLSSLITLDNSLESFYDKIVVSVPEEAPIFPRLDSNFLKERFSFTLAQKDVEVFLHHYLIWQKVASSKSEYAIIYDTEVDIIADGATIDRSIESREQNWDIIFPYDKSEMVDYQNLQPTQLGVHWGANVYFLTKEGAQKLLNYAVLRQSVDDEILYLSLKDVLHTYAENMGFFKIKNDSLEIPFYRKVNIYNSLKINREIVGQDLVLAKAILNTLSKTAGSRGFFFMLFAGSLLGHIRHGGIMPWDDDIDLAVDIKYISVVLNVLSRNDNIVFEKAILPGAEWYYYKVWHKLGKEILGHKHKFPFVDIWLYEEHESTINFIGGEVFAKHEYYPPHEIVFEENIFSIPKNPLYALDIQYKTWRSQIRKFSYSHREEKYKNTSYSLGITVDEAGKFNGF